MTRLFCEVLLYADTTVWSLRLAIPDVANEKAAKDDEMPEPVPDKPEMPNERLR